MFQRLPGILSEQKWCMSIFYMTKLKMVISSKPLELLTLSKKKLRARPYYQLSPELPQISLSGTSGPMQSVYFLLLDRAKSFTMNEIFNVSSGPIYIIVPNFVSIVLKGDIMVRHHIGLNQMHPDRSSCLNLSANVSVG